MKFKKTVIATACLIIASTAYSARPRIEIEPPHWWTGMEQTSLQLQVHYKNIRNAVPTVVYPGVTIDSVARLDGSPDWQYIYLNISPEARPGKMRIDWRDGKQRLRANYELKSRSGNTPQTITAADVLYMVMPDRFADGNPDNNRVATMQYPVGADRSNLNVRHGGDLTGIMQHVDYLDSLGINALWLNPVLENDMPGGSYHGYATTDYYNVDPRLGTNTEYKALIDTLRSKGIKTVMDMIFNHCGSAHPWRIAPPSSDWFNFQNEYKQTNYRLSTITDPYASDYDQAMTEHGWFVEEMPDLNQKNPHLMRYLTQNSIWWIEEAGIDGIRMDTYPYADRAAMGEWVADVQRQYPGFFIVGECWFGDPASISRWQRGSTLAPQGEDTNLPAMMDFPLMIKSRELKPFTDHTDPWNGLNTIYDHLALDYIYPNPLQLLRFFDNHDTERMLLTEPDSLGAWKQAMGTLLTIPGIPQIYYGTELLMAGDRRPGDGNVRRDMPGGFPGDTVSVFNAESRTPLQREAYDYLSKLLHWRSTSEAVAHGKMKHFMPTNGVYLYKRYIDNAPEKDVIVVMNGTDGTLQTDMSRYKEVIVPNAKYKDIITGEIVELLSSDGASYTFSPRQIMILIPAQ